MKLEEERIRSKYKTPMDETPLDDRLKKIERKQRSIERELRDMELKQREMEWERRWK